MKKTLIILSILFMIPLLDLFHPGLPITHDGQDHVARIANFFINLQYGVIVPRWGSNLNWGYGHPVLEFLYPLPSYLASFFHAFGFSFINAAKIVLGAGMFFSGVTMYIWLSSLFGKKAGIIGSMLYVFAPYRFVELYVRGDIGENLAFVFVPLVFLFIDRLAKKSDFKNILLGATSFACLLLSHNAMSLMFLPIVIIYAVFRFYSSAKNKKKFFYSFFAAIFLGFGLAAFFWVPAFFEGKFTLRNIVTAGVYKTRFVSFGQLLYGPWSYLGTGKFTVQLGILHWLCLLSSIILLPFFWMKKKSLFFFSLIMVVFSVISVFLMLSQSDFIWSKIMLLQNFQFPWRFLAIVVFTPAVLASMLLTILKTKFQIAVVFVTVIVLFFLSKDYWHANGYAYKPDSFFTATYNGTTDTGESSPVWSVRFMEKRAKAPIEVISGNADIIQVNRKPTIHTYSIKASVQSQILENTLYFPGWSIYVDGKKTPIEFQNPLFRGLMTFSVPQGQHIVQASFSETKLRLLSDIISVCSIISIAILFLFRKKLL